MFGSGITWTAAIVIPRHAAKTKLEKSKSGAQGNSNTPSVMALAAESTKTCVWFQSMAIIKSFHSICILRGF